MFFRRYIVGVSPLLIWAEDEEAADITALIHACQLMGILRPECPWLPFRSVQEPE